VDRSVSVFPERPFPTGLYRSFIKPSGSKVSPGYNVLDLAMLYCVYVEKKEAFAGGFTGGKVYAVCTRRGRLT
jgi:hypothetical protein